MQKTRRHKSASHPFTSLSNPPLSLDASWNTIQYPPTLHTHKRRENDRNEAYSRAPADLSAKKTTAAGAVAACRAVRSTCAFYYTSRGCEREAGDETSEHCPFLDRFRLLRLVHQHTDTSNSHIHTHDTCAVCIRRLYYPPMRTYVALRSFYTPRASQNKPMGQNRGVFPFPPPRYMASVPSRAEGSALFSARRFPQWVPLGTTRVSIFLLFFVVVRCMFSHY